ncbi:MAG TPA: aldolase/citrate lyase family protein [Rhodocyclaceae bacterium]|nr:aldolase/citrate lyase family protein [Rhodocyclaceae bacterium]
MSKAHPDEVLYQKGSKRFPVLPACEHYAGSAKLIAKALALQVETSAAGGPVFDLTCDCEDGAATGQERLHAEMIADFINSDANRYGRVGVRIHDLSHPHWRQDIDILISRAGERIAYMVLPKAERAADVLTQIGILDATRARYGVTREIPVHILIETHGALRDVWEIAALPHVESIDFGIMDFVSSHHGAVPGNAMISPGQFAHPLLVRAKTEISAAALANNVVPSHNVTTEIRDAQIVGDDAERARREFGYLRMWSIHPNQIRPIVEAMQPDYSEVEMASEIVCAAQNADWGPIQHAGKLHDRASYRYYWELLQRAHATGMDLPAPARQRFFNA